jgi:septum formation protein
VPHFEIIKPEVEEIYPSDLKIEKVPAYLSKLKAHHLSSSIADSNALLITSDTVVISGNKLLEKPTDQSDAARMISALADKKHSVITAVCIMDQENTVELEDQTHVFFSSFTPEEIAYYVHNFEVLDKAGAYGVQDWLGMAKINRIEGSFYTVMGFPTHLVYQALKDWK